MEKLPNVTLVNDYENDAYYVSLFNKYKKALSNYVDAYKRLEKVIANFNQVRKKYKLEKINLW